MTNRLALVVAIVLGVLSILGIRFYVEKIKTEYTAQAQLVDLPVAAREIRNGEVVTEKDIQTRKFPRAILEGLGKYLDDAKVIEGSKVVVPEIKQGSVFQQYHFRRTYVKTSLKISEGHRALTIPVNNLTGIAGMLKPNDFVDIVMSQQFQLTGATVGSPGGAKGLKVTRTLLEKVQILALDDRTDSESQFQDYSTATLQLRPDDANKLLNALDAGSVMHLLKVEAKEEPSKAASMWDSKAFREIEPEIRKEEERWRGK